MGQTPKPGEPAGGSIRNVMIRNVIARGKGSSLVNGHRDSWLEDISFENVKLFLSTDPAAPYDTAVNAIDFRWARNLRIKDFEVFWEKPALDRWQSALSFEDVEGLDLDRFSGRQAWPEKDAPAVLLNNVANAVIRDSRALEGTKVFLTVLGKNSRNILLRDNDLRKTNSPYQLESVTTKNVVKASGNLIPGESR
jgi:hypothetical protein